MSLITSYEFSNSFSLNYHSDLEEDKDLKIYKILKKLLKKPIVREWDLYGPGLEFKDFENYLDDADFKNKLNGLKVTDLKDILSDYGLKKSGTKSELLTRCIENIPEDDLKRYVDSEKLYKCNENAQKFVKDNEYLDYFIGNNSNYMAYFFRSEDIVKLFKDVSKSEMKIKIIEYLSDYELSGNVGENLALLLALLEIYDNNEDLINYLKTCVKIILIVINEFFNLPEPLDWRTLPLDDNTNFFLQYTFHDVERLIDSFNYLVNACPNFNFLETIILESYDEIDGQIPNLTKENSIYYITSALLGKDLYSCLNDEIPQNSNDCIEYFNKKQKIEYKRLFILFLKDVGRFRRYNPMDYTEKHYFNKSLEEGLIELQNPSASLDYYDINELRDRLAKFNPIYFNTKEGYRNWAKENLSEAQIKSNFPYKVYGLTDKGKEFLKDNIHYTLFKNAFYEIFIIGLSDYEPYALRNYEDIELSDKEPIISLKEYEEDLGSLDNLIKFINEKTLKEDIENQMWYKYARDLELLNNICHLSGSNEKDITKNFLKSYLIKLNAWYREDQTNPDLTYGYNLHNYRYDEKYDEFFHEIYSTMEVPHLFFSEEESKEIMEYSHSSFDLREELKKRISIYENGEENAPEPNYLGDDWIDNFIGYKEFLGFDIDDDSLHIYREEMCLDFEDETLRNKVDEFFIKLDNLLSQNKSHDEIKEELKEYTDLINVEGEKHAKELRNQRLNEEKLRKRYRKISDNARTSEDRRNYEEAIKLYNEAIRISEENPNIGFNPFYHYHRLLIIYRKMKDYDNEMEVCENILSKYEGIVQKEGYGYFLTDNYDEKFIKKYKASRLKELKNHLEFENEGYDFRKREINRLNDDINRIKTELEKFDETKDDISIKNHLEYRLFSIEEYLKHMEEISKIENSKREDLESEIENFDKNFVFNKEEIVFPENVREYKKYQKRLERIKQLKEKSK